MVGILLAYGELASLSATVKYIVRASLPNAPFAFKKAPLEKFGRTVSEFTTILPKSKISFSFSEEIKKKVAILVKFSNRPVCQLFSKCFGLLLLCVVILFDEGLPY